MKFSEKIKDLRSKHQLTQEELAKKLYVTRNAISKWENDKGYPNIESLRLISQQFDISIDDLLNENDIRAIIIDTDEKVNLIYNFSFAIITFLSYTIVGVLIPFYLLLLDPTGGMAYGLFIGPVCFMLLAFLLGMFTRNPFQTMISAVIGIIPSLIYYEYAHIFGSIMALVYFILFASVLSFTYYFKYKITSNKYKLIINIIVLVVTFCLYLALNIIGIVEDLNGGYRVTSTILRNALIFLIPFILEITSLFYIKRRYIK